MRPDIDASPDCVPLPSLTRVIANEFSGITKWPLLFAYKTVLWVMLIASVAEDDESQNEELFGIYENYSVTDNFLFITFKFNASTRAAVSN